MAGRGQAGHRWRRGPPDAFKRPREPLRSDFARDRIGVRFVFREASIDTRLRDALRWIRTDRTARRCCRRRGARHADPLQFEVLNMSQALDNAGRSVAAGLRHNKLVILTT